MAYRDFKDSTRRTASDQILGDKVHNVAKNLKYDGYQRGLALMGYTIFEKKLFVQLLKMKIYQIKN